jgi:hypothetical protein
MDVLMLYLSLLAIMIVILFVVTLRSKKIGGDDDGALMIFENTPNDHSKPKLDFDDIADDIMNEALYENVFEE